MSRPSPRSAPLDCDCTVIRGKRSRSASTAAAGSVPAGSKATGGSARVSASRASAVKAKSPNAMAGRRGTVDWRSRCTSVPPASSSVMSVRWPLSRSTVAEKPCAAGSPGRAGL